MTTPKAFGHPSLEQYDEHLCLRSVSARTRGEYGRYLRKLAAHCGRDPATLEEPEARSYLLYLKEQKGYAPSSMRIAAAGPMSVSSAQHCFRLVGAAAGLHQEYAFQIIHANLRIEGIPRELRKRIGGMLGISEVGQASWLVIRGDRGA